MYQDDDIFDVGPILGKGRKYNEYRDDQARDPKTGKWTPEGAAAMARNREKAKREAAGKKPTSKPKSTAKPAKKPASKPKAPDKKPKTKPKAEAAPAKKPRARKPKQEVATTEQPESRQSTALVPVDRNKPIDVQAEPVPEKPASGLVERDRKTLDDHYARYDAMGADIDKMTSDLDKMQARADRIYDELSRMAPEGWRHHSMNRELTDLDDSIARMKTSIGRKTAERETLRGTIEELDRRLRSQKRRYIAKLFEEKASTAVDFKTAFNKIVPDNGQPPSGDAGNPLGLVFGWAIVCKESGKPYFDTQGDHIPEDSMLKAATDFMLTKRDLKVMHKGKRVGTVVFAWPVTKDIAKAMGLDGNRTGLMIGVKPDSSTIVDRFRQGEYTGFSIGGNRLVDEPVL